MVKNKYIGVALGCLVVVAVGTVILIKHAHHPADQLGNKFDNLQTAAANAAAAAPAGNNSLNVSSQSPASNLGQLGNGPSSQQSTAQSPTTQGSGSTGSSGSSAANNPFDPSTYAQYDKYKSSQGALFGDVQKGSGTAVSANHKAAVLYRGWLTNGQLFDQSKAGSDGKLQPFVFTEGAHQVIPGWEQGLDGMKVGGVRLLIVPPAVGYGATGQGSIPPNSVLIFQVQLLDVQ